MDDSREHPIVVPIGTRGRPGRGSRSHSPSAAARSLANGAPVPSATAASRSRVRPEQSGSTRRPPTGTAPTPPLTSIDGGAGDRGRGNGGAEESPHPPPGADGTDDIPVGDWIAALLAAAQEVLGEDWEARSAVLVAQLRKRVTGDYEVDPFGLDPQIQEIAMAMLRPMSRTWFRTEIRGAENIPREGGALIVGNHSGTIPLDAAMTMLAVNDHGGRTLRLLGADLVFSLPFVGELARKTGATLACNEDAERLLRRGEVAGVWPEGFKGVGKPYAERYKLQRFGRGGFVSAAMRTGVPIVPVSIVGAEEIYPMVGNIPSLARLLGLPYVPITPLFPLLGPLGLVPLPSKWIIEFGEPIRTDAYDESAADDPMLVFNVTDQVRETIQQTLYSLLVDRGHPFF